MIMTIIKGKYSLNISKYKVFVFVLIIVSDLLILCNITLSDAF